MRFGLAIPAAFAIKITSFSPCCSSMLIHSQPLICPVRVASIRKAGSPASTSALTYGVKLRHAENGQTWIYLNRNHNDTDSDLTLRATSSLTLMELSA